MSTTFALGTAQLGMPSYGIANDSGPPSQVQALALLEEAYQSGVTLWDTSPAYGKSEEYIGRYENGSPAICTKLPSVSEHIGEEAGARAVEEYVQAQVAGSCERMQKTRLDYYLLHDERDLRVCGEEVFEALRGCKEKGQVRETGISVYTPSVAHAALDVKDVDALQLPLNVLDHRFLEVMQEAENKNVTVFARSVFLQGLLFLAPGEAERKVPGAGKPIRALRKIAQGASRSVASIAVSFARDVPGVSSLVIGVETPQQLQNNTQLLDAPPLSKAVKEQVEHQFSSLPLSVVNPAAWEE